eukprot:6184797-Pleurochrysis_carterae.AAC.1
MAFVVDLKKLAAPASHAPRARQIGHACCSQQHRAPNSAPSSGADTAQYQTPEDGTNTPTRRQAPLPNQKYVAAAEKYGNVRARPHGRIERGIDNRKQPSAEHNGQRARQLHVKARARIYSKARKVQSDKLGSRKKFHAPNDFHALNLGDES